MNNYILTYDDFDFGKIDINSDPALSGSDNLFSCDWIDRFCFYVVLKPEFHRVKDWPSLIEEFEHQLHTDYKAYFTPIIQNHVSHHTIEELLKFRKSTSIHHRFGLPTACLDPLLREHDAPISIGRGHQFWTKYNDGLLPDDLIKEIILESVYPPKSGEPAVDFSVYIKEMPSQSRSAWINWGKTFSNFSSPTDFLRFMVEMNRLCIPWFSENTRLDKAEMLSILSSKFVARSSKFNNMGASAWLSFATLQLCSFLYRKQLIIIPTSSNYKLLLNRASKCLTNNIAARPIKNKLPPPEQYKDKFGFIPTSFSQDAYIDTVLSTFLGPASVNHQADTSIDDSQSESSQNIQPINSDLLSEHQPANFVRRITDLLFDEAPLAIANQSKDGFSVYNIYEPGKHENLTIFNRSSHVILLDDFFRINNWQLILSEFQAWTSNLANDYLNIDEIDISSIPTDKNGFSDYLFNILDEANNLSDLPKIRITQKLHIGELIAVFLWSRHLLLLPCYGHTIGCAFPIESIVSDFDSLLKKIVNDLKKNNFNIPYYRNGNKQLVRRFSSLLYGLKYTLFASTPIQSLNLIKQAHIELLWKYGISDANSSRKSEFRLLVRGLTYYLSKMGKNVNYKHLSTGPINARLPTKAVSDPFNIWMKNNLDLWHEWLTRLIEKNAARINNKDVVRNINGILLPFLTEYAKTHNSEIPSSPFEVTPIMIISEVPGQLCLKSYIDRKPVKNKHGLFSSCGVPFIELQTTFPDECKKLRFVLPFPKKNPFKSNKRNATHRYPIESLHLDTIKEVLFDCDENGQPTFEWVKREYCLFYENIPNNKKRDIIITEDGPIWWPGTAACLGFLLEVPLRSFQARWLCQGNLDNQLYDPNTRSYIPNTNIVKAQYTDGKTHAEKYKNKGGVSGVLQQRKISFMTSESDDSAASTPAIFVNTNKTSITDNHFDQGYYIPWPCEEGTDLPYRLLQHMIDFNNKYEPQPTPINLAFEQERNKINTKQYSPTSNPEVINSHPWVIPVFRDLTRTEEYTASPDFSYDGDGNLITPPVSQNKLYGLFKAIIKEAERRLKGSYPDEIASMRHANGEIKYDIHTLRVTGVSRLIASGVPIAVVRDVVGHAAESMTFYYTILDQLQILQHLREGTKFDLQSHKLGDFSNIEDFIFPNRAADESAVISYGGWVERNGGICPSALCEEGGPADKDEDGNVLRFHPVPGGPFRCGNCRHWMTGPQYLMQQIHFADLLMKQIIDTHRDRCDIYERQLELESELDESQNQNLLAEISQIKSSAHQLTERIAIFWMEWRNRYEHIEQSIASLDKYSEEFADGKLALTGDINPREMNIERHAGSEFGVKRSISHALILPIQITQDHKSVLNELERDLTKLQLLMNKKSGAMPLLAQIMDDDVRDRCIALGAQSLFLQFSHHGLEGDIAIDKLLSSIKNGTLKLGKNEKDALTKWKSGLEEVIGIKSPSIESDDKPKLN